MANAATIITLPRSFSKGRGFQIDNQEGDIAVVNKDASTTVTVTSGKLKRILSAIVFDANGTQINATITGYGTNAIALSALGTDTLDLVVLMKGSRL